MPGGLGIGVVDGTVAREVENAAVDGERSAAPRTRYGPRPLSHDCSSGGAALGGLGGEATGVGGDAAAGGIGRGVGVGVDCCGGVGGGVGGGPDGSVGGEVFEELP